MSEAKDVQTEELIKEAAKRVFFCQGKINAKMQDIADEAGVNRALLHYYFRNREKLIAIILKEAIQKTINNMVLILSSSEPIRIRIKKTISFMIDEMIDYPHIEAFILNEFSLSEESLISIDSTFSKVLPRLFQELEDEMRLMNYPYVDGRHFLINMTSLVTYPFVSKKIIMLTQRFSEEQYREFVLSRKEIIYSTLFFGCTK